MKYTPQDWVTLLGAVGLLVGAIATGVAKILLSIKEVKISIDGRMEELVKLTRMAALAEGRDMMRPTEPVVADTIVTDNINTDAIVHKAKGD